MAIIRWTWPRTAAAAGSFWHYDGALYWGDRHSHVGFIKSDNTDSKITA
jgi:hypothetical protein